MKEHPTFTMREVNSHVSELWKEVGDEDRRMYQQQAKENYENRIERYNSATGNSDVLQCISCIEMMINIIYYFANFWLKKLQGCSQELLTSILH